MKRELSKTTISDRTRRAALKVLRDPLNSKRAKTAAGLALSQRMTEAERRKVKCINLSTLNG